MQMHFVHCEVFDVKSWNIIRFFKLNFEEEKVKRSTVKPVLSGHSKIDKTKILMTNGRLMKVESIAECSRWSILKYF